MSTIYNALDDGFRVLVTRPSGKLTLEEYLNYLRDQQRAWRSQLIAGGEKDLKGHDLTLQERLIKGISINDNKVPRGVANNAEAMDIDVNGLVSGQLIDEVKHFHLI
ncbi:hypothetical protein F4805DRAFT_460176 [Annulohypoxylon moriforme]|nr:hypothetical protein F4805DRAFT_460176 [Annulohypoxylon moriforme]